MARVTFTNEDILRAKLLQPGWYPMIVKTYEETAAGTDGSALYVYSIVVDAGHPMAGVPVRYQISEKALGMGIDFLESAGYEVKPGQPIELEKVVGKKLQGYVQRGEYNGRANNQLTAFKKAV